MDKAEEAARKIKSWRENPCKFVYENFQTDPDHWQVEVLDAFASKDPAKMRISLQACAGPGKTAALCFCGWNFLSCYGEKGEHPKGAAVSITHDNLKDNLWPEFSKWQQRSEYLKQGFTWTKERIFAKQHPETWFFSARSWSKKANAEEQGRTLSGLHSKYVLALLDESGEIPLSVLKAGEQALSNCEFGKIIQAGNPTSHDGILYAAATILRHLWHIVRITGDPEDPKRSHRIDLEWAKEQIKTYGRDNPWVMAYILGQFPPGSINTLLGPDEVAAAMERHYTEDQFSFSQKRIGVDVARFGLDSTVLFPRQGLAAFNPVEMRNARTHEIAARIALAKARWGSEMEMIDDTGGWGAGVIDSLIQAGHSPLAVNFSGKATDPRYQNKRAEMWFEMADWVKRGGALPNHAQLSKELTTPTFYFQEGRFRMEEKDQIKKRLGFSPDYADALCFAGDTLISTPGGSMAISEIKTGDEVLTPFGKTQVTRVWESTTSRITSVRFSNGMTLAGKGEHKIFTWDKGWVPLDQLTKVSQIESAHPFRRYQWKTLQKLFTRTNPFGFKTQVDIINQEGAAGKLRRRDFYIEGYGRNITGLFLQALLSITRMAIGKITESRIWKWWNAECIVGTIQRNLCPTLSIGPGHWKHLRRQLLLRQNGIGVMKGGSGISNMGKIAGLEGRPSIIESVKFVGLNIKPFLTTLKRWKASAQKGVRAPMITMIAKMTKEFACAVEKNLSPTNIGRPDIAVMSVQTVAVHGQKVYNLTLQHDNVYYANGILVANCLTFALPEMPASIQLPGMPKAGRLISDYDPFDEKRTLA